MAANAAMNPLVVRIVEEVQGSGCCGQPML
jgi:hypothetical protein